MVTTRARSAPLQSDASGGSGGTGRVDTSQHEVSSRRCSSSSRRKDGGGGSGGAMQAAEALEAIQEDPKQTEPPARRSTRSTAAGPLPDVTVLEQGEPGPSSGPTSPSGPSIGKSLGSSSQQLSRRQRRQKQADRDVQVEQQEPALSGSESEDMMAVEALIAGQEQLEEKQQLQQQQQQEDEVEEDEGESEQELQEETEEHESLAMSQLSQQQLQQQQEGPQKRGRRVVASSRAAAEASALSDSEDSDLDLDGEGVLGQLAASIRQALHSTAGPSSSAGHSKRSQKQQQGPDQLPRWQPATGLTLPPLAARAGLGAGEMLGGVPQPEESKGSLLPTTGAAADAAGRAAAGVRKERGLVKQLYAPTKDANKAAKEARKAAPDTAGGKWYDLPATQITEEVKQDLRLLRLRGAYDPKRFYKTFDSTKFPRYFQMGTVVDDPLDFYGGRLTQQQRKATLTEQLLADTELTHVRKKRYGKLQEEATKHVKVKRRKTEQPRKAPSKHRPKH